MRLLAGGSAAAVLLADLPGAGAAVLPAGGVSLIGSIVRSPGCAARLAARLERCWGGPEGVATTLAEELAALRSQAAAAATPQQLAANLQQAVREDFAASRVVMLDGCMLTRTELALYWEAAGSLPCSDGAAP